MDVDTISVNKDLRPTDLSHMLNDGISKINIKLLVWLLLIFLLVSSDVFISRVLSKFDGVDPSHPYVANNKGTVIQGLLLVLMYTFIDILNKADVL